MEPHHALQKSKRRYVFACRLHETLVYFRSEDFSNHLFFGPFVSSTRNHTLFWKNAFGLRERPTFEGPYILRSPLINLRRSPANNFQNGGHRAMQSDLNKDLCVCSRMLKFMLLALRAQVLKKLKIQWCHHTQQILKFFVRILMRRCHIYIYIYI